MKISLLFQLSGFHSTLPLAEIEAMLSLYGSFNLLEKTERFAIFDFVGKRNVIDSLRRRLSLVHGVFEFLGRCKLGDIETFFKEKQVQIEMPYRIRMHGMLINDVIDRVADIIENKSLHPCVSLEHPKTSIELFIKGKDVYITKLLFYPDKSFMKHSPKHRPFIRPVAMDARIARCMVNLSRIANGKLIDPVCGTGGILIEAASMGIKVYGMDKERTMVKGTKQNLEFFGYSGDVMQGDVITLDKLFPHNYFDAVVCDMPYGISSSLGNIRRDVLYSKAIVAMRNVVKKGHYVVIMVPEEINLLNVKMKLIEIHKERVHTNLTRRIYVLRKECD